jgi:amino acid transporter
MDLTDVIEISLLVTLFVFALLCLASLIPLALWRKRGRTWKQKIPHPGQFIGIRLGIAASIGGAMFVLVAAALTLNQERPPEDDTPVATVRGATGLTSLSLELERCGDPIDGEITVRGKNPRQKFARIYSDQDGFHIIRLNRAGIGRFTLSDPTERHGFLSCYLQIPVVKGGRGSTSFLTLGEAMEVNPFDSIPAPTGYSSGRWSWHCNPGKSCPVLAAVDLDIEDGAKQVIVLVLAAVFGAIIALFIGEVVIEPSRRRLDRLKHSETDSGDD